LTTWFVASRALLLDTAIACNHFDLVTHDAEVIRAAHSELDENSYPTIYSSMIIFQIAPRHMKMVAGSPIVYLIRGTLSTLGHSFTSNL